MYALLSSQLAVGMAVVEIVGEQLVERGRVAAHRGFEARQVRGPRAGFVWLGAGVLRETGTGHQDRDRQQDITDGVVRRVFM